MIDLLLFILWAYSPYIILRPIIFIFELFDHESYECIEDWNVIYSREKDSRKGYLDIREDSILRKNSSLGI